MTLTFYRSGIRRRWRWRLTGANHEKIGREAQAAGFGTLGDAKHNAGLVLGGTVTTGMGPFSTVEGRPDIKVEVIM